MRDVAQAVLSELDLDYAITLVSGGESGNYEIVMWDRPRNSYFSVRFKWSAQMSNVEVADDIRAQLLQRIASHTRVKDRRPLRSGQVPELGVG